VSYTPVPGRPAAGDGQKDGQKTETQQTGKTEQAEPEGGA
jgi:hypothetical protein